jgi:acyl carrier protein
VLLLNIKGNIMGIANADERFLALIAGLEEILEATPGTLSGSSDFKSHPNWDSLAALSAMVYAEDIFKRFIDPSVFKASESIAELYSAVVEAG